ncbi:MAG: addiction module protein [Anditalea sp.]
MKEVTLKIPESKFTFFMELVEQLGFEVAEELEISEAHKAIVRDRIKKSDQNPERLLDWEQVQDNFQLD